MAAESIPKDLFEWSKDNFVFSHKRKKFIPRTKESYCLRCDRKMKNKVYCERKDIYLGKRICFECTELVIHRFCD